jgi:general secretion pathway protein G
MIYKNKITTDNHHNRAAQHGFTLVEMLLVLVILATLAAIVVPKFAGRSKQAKVTAAQTQISNFEITLDAFEVDNGFYPKGSDGLEALVDKPSNANNWRGPYLKQDIPFDPWGNEYIYENPGKYNSEAYDLYSLGPDGRVGGDDDITNWKTTQKR